MPEHSLDAIDGVGAKNISIIGIVDGAAINVMKSIHLL